MAIDFGRMARGVATGYLSAKIANTEANDKMNADIIKAAGLNFYEKELPEHQAKEKLYDKDFKQVAALYGTEKANYFADKGFFGDGNGLNNVSNVLDKFDMSSAELKKLKLSTREERKAERLSTIQDREKTIMNLTSGSSKIGNMTANLLIDDKATMVDASTDTATETQPSNVEGTPIIPIQERSMMEADTTTGSIFTPKGPDVEGVQSRYQHVANAVNQLQGYTTEVFWGEGGQINFNLFGDRKNEAAAHIALANKLVIEDPQNYNQNNAATTAKQQLDYLTVNPFNNIAGELGVKYFAGNGKDAATLGTVGDSYDANQILKSGQTIDQVILGSIGEIPVGPSGEVNQAVLERLLENIPDELTLNGKNYKQELKTQLAIRSSNFWSTRKI